MKHIKQNIYKVTTRQNTEFGLVLVAVAALLAVYKKQDYYLYITFIFSFITLIVPVVFYPFTVFWFGLSKILSAVSSRVLLTIIFFLVVHTGSFDKKDGRKRRHENKAV